MTSQSIEALLGAVIERTNSTGALCHEETVRSMSLWAQADDSQVGDYASFISEQSYLELQSSPD